MFILFNFTQARFSKHKNNIQYGVNISYRVADSDNQKLLHSGTRKFTGHFTGYNIYTIFLSIDNFYPKSEYLKNIKKLYLDTTEQLDF